ncbi:hypothetical protein Acr_29g0000930 [Actinidia rufa]|uniref:Uncharacterized protein n=1 Tax=Actinidia rufa TaxID=165716 RepID=A0A7J0HD87_9ERIC|nr:hypothetical protein Acr_29g0000930 [Actinidia rufa]
MDGELMLHCNEELSLSLPVTEATLYKIRGTIILTYTGIEDNQNCYSAFYYATGSSATVSDLPELLNQQGKLGFSLKIIIFLRVGPSDTNWILFMENLDHGGFTFPLALKRSGGGREGQLLLDSSNIGSPNGNQLQQFGQIQPAQMNWKTADIVNMQVPEVVFAD